MTQTPAAPRLGYLLKKFPRLSETFILNELLGQEALGSSLRVLSRRSPDDEPRHPQLENLEAEVETLPPARSIDPWTTLFGERAEDRLFYPRVRALVARNRANPHPRFPSLLVEALFLLRRTAELGLRHLHVHFASDAAFVALLLRELGGPSFSVTAHAKDIFRETVNLAQLDRIVRTSEFTVTVCDANVDYLRERLSPAAMSRVRRLYNGIDLARFSRVRSEPREATHILAVGRLVEKKGFHVLLEALAELDRKGLEFRATIVGDGEERQALTEQAERLELSERVTWAGACPQDQVAELLGRATLFCLPCIEGRDGNKDALPTVLLEALASGLPSISTPISGIPEIFDRGRAGVLVEPGEVGALAAAVEELLADSGRRRSLAIAGRSQANKHFDVRRTAEQLGQWFEDVTPRVGAEVA